MEEIYLETVSNIINDIEKFEKVIANINTEDINFFTITLSVFKNFIIYPYKDSLKVVARQLNDLFDSKEKEEMKLLWSKNMLIQTLEEEIAMKYKKDYFDNVCEELLKVDIIEEIKEEITEKELKKYVEIYLRLSNIFNTRNIRVIRSGNEIFLIINLKMIILNSLKINELSNILKLEISLKEISIIPQYNWENEFDENAKGVSVILKFKGE